MMVMSHDGDHDGCDDGDYDAYDLGPAVVTLYFYT